jgi:hypothetical protein
VKRARRAARRHRPGFSFASRIHVRRGVLRSRQAILRRHIEKVVDASKRRVEERQYGGLAKAVALLCTAITAVTRPGLRFLRPALGHLSRDCTAGMKPNSCYKCATEEISCVFLSSCPFLFSLFFPSSPLRTFLFPGSLPIRRCGWAQLLRDASAHTLPLVRWQRTTSSIALEHVGGFRILAVPDMLPSFTPPLPYLSRGPCHPPHPCLFSLPLIKSPVPRVPHRPRTQRGTYSKNTE